MAQTSPDNLWSPDPGSNANVPVATAAMQDTVQAALNRRSGTGVATRNTDIPKPSQSELTQSPLSNFNVTGTTIAATSNGFRLLEDGVFLITGRVTFEPSIAGTLQVVVWVNGGSQHTFVRKGAGPEDYTTPVDIATVNVMSEGDIITLGSSHTSGSTKDETSARLTVTKLA